MPLVTVVIPAYNAATFIGQTLASVQKQTLTDVEVLLVDDGSTDRTVEVASGFVGPLNLKIITQANAGPAAARNNGVRSAAGRYCAFVDSDDAMLPERLAAQAAALDADPELGLVHTDLMTFNDTGIVHRTRRAFSNPRGGRVLEDLLLENFITTSTVMAPTEKLCAAGLFNEARRLSEDYELWLEMARRWPIGYLDRPLVQYRARPGSLSANKLVTGLSALQVVEEFWDKHPDLGRQAASLRRRSLARHLLFAGAAAFGQRNRRVAVATVLRSLAYEPASTAGWKWLAKSLVGSTGSPAPAAPKEA